MIKLMSKIRPVKSEYVSDLNSPSALVYSIMMLHCLGTYPLIPGILNTPPTHVWFDLTMDEWLGLLPPSPFQYLCMETPLFDSVLR